ncbi:11509_t:CDS:2, partial [Funneliformis mosseae]
LSLEESLSYIPPPIIYSPKCTTSKATTKANGDPPTRFVQNKVVFCEENVRVAIDVNICMVLNRLMAPGYNFLRRRIHTSGIPDFNCYLLELLILVFETKRKHVLEDMVSTPRAYRALDFKDSSVTVRISTDTKSICLSTGG